VRSEINMFIGETDAALLTGEIHREMACCNAPRMRWPRSRRAFGLCLTAIDRSAASIRGGASWCGSPEHVSLSQRPGNTIFRPGGWTRARPIALQTKYLPDHDSFPTKAFESQFRKQCSGGRFAHGMERRL